MKFITFLEKIKKIKPEYLISIQQIHSGFSVGWQKNDEVVFYEFNRNPTDEMIDIYRKKLEKKWTFKKSSK